jgi:type I restriction enzyme S subunit
MRELRIKDICDKGSSNLKQKDVENGKGKYPVYGASGISGYIDTYHQEKEYISIVKDGSGIGRVSFMPARTSVIGTLQYILPKEGYNIKYISYCLQSLNLSEYKQGAAIPHIYFRDYGEFVVKVEENIAEQERIVALLDDQFAKIDALKANAASQLQAAKDLFQSALKEYLTPKEGWEKKSITELCESISAGGDAPKDHMSEEMTEQYKYPIYSNGVESEGLYGYTDDYKIDKPAITIAARGTIGATFIRKIPFTPIVRLITLIPNDSINIAFLYYLIKSLNIGHTGSSIPQLTVPMVKELEFYIPYAFKEQRDIVVILDSLSDKVARLQENYNRTLTLCNDLKQSLLKSIFE